MHDDLKARYPAVAILLEPLVLLKPPVHVFLMWLGVVLPAILLEEILHVCIQILKHAVTAVAQQSEVLRKLQGACMHCH